jgi:hypothetical protein
LDAICQIEHSILSRPIYSRPLILTRPTEAVPTNEHLVSISSEAVRVVLSFPVPHFFLVWLGFDLAREAPSSSAESETPGKASSFVGGERAARGRAGVRRWRARKAAVRLARRRGTTGARVRGATMKMGGALEGVEISDGEQGAQEFGDGRSAMVSKSLLS